MKISEIASALIDFGHANGATKIIQDGELITASHEQQIHDALIDYPLESKTPGDFPIQIEFGNNFNLASGQLLKKLSDLGFQTENAPVDLGQGRTRLAAGVFCDTLPKGGYSINIQEPTH